MLSPGKSPDLQVYGFRGAASSASGARSARELACGPKLDVCLLCKTLSHCSRIIQHRNPQGELCGPHPLCRTCCFQMVKSHNGALGQFTCPFCKRHLGTRRRALEVDVKNFPASPMPGVPPFTASDDQESGCGFKIVNYAVLGVAVTATDQQVRAAYRRQALRAHPDAGGDSAAFCKLTQAYEAIMLERSGTSTESDSADAASGDLHSQAVVFQASLHDVPSSGWAARLSQASTALLKALAVKLHQPSLPPCTTSTSWHSTPSSRVCGAGTRGLMKRFQGGQTVYNVRVSFQNLVIESTPTPLLAKAIETLEAVLSLKAQAIARKAGLSTFFDVPMVLFFSYDARVKNKPRGTTPVTTDLTTAVMMRRDMLASIHSKDDEDNRNSLTRLRREQQCMLQKIRNENLSILQSHMGKAIAKELEIRRSCLPHPDAPARKRLRGKQSGFDYYFGMDSSKRRRKATELERGKERKQALPPSPPVTAGEGMQEPKKQPPECRRIVLTTPVPAVVHMPWFWPATKAMGMTESEGLQFLQRFQVSPVVQTALRRAFCALKIEDKKASDGFRHDP